MVVLDATIVNVALPSIQHGLGFSRGEPAVDRQRVHPRLRRLPAARRPRLRPARPAAALHRGRVRVHGRVADQRHRDDLRRAGRRARAAGARRRARLAGRALDRHDDVQGRRGAHEGARRLERDRRRRRRRRPDPRRPADRDALVALGLLHQPADRDRRGAARRCASSRTVAPRSGPRPRTSPAPSRSPPGCSCSSTASSRPRTTAGRSGKTLGLARGRGRAARRVRPDRAALEGAADPARASSASAR